VGGRDREGDQNTSAGILRTLELCCCPVKASPVYCKNSCTISSFFVITIVRKVTYKCFF
jgi:predicted metal-binding transcription factor (methanogenesis marker protein 9)